MPRYIQHELPRRNFNGMIGVYCRKCGREICLRTNSQIRSVEKCAICVLREQGVENPEESVLQQYFMFDPTKPPVPIDAEGDSAIVNLFPEEKQEFERMPSSGGIAGTVKSIYRAVGFKIVKAIEEKSQKVAKKRRNESSLFK